MMRRHRFWLLRLVSVLIGMVVLLAAVEAAFWILPVREAMPGLLPSGNDRIARFHPNERWRYSAGWNFFIVNELRTNNAGWVSEIDYVREADSPLLAFVGDSFVQGDHLPWADTCHGRLARRLEEEIRVYSFAINGVPLSQYLSYAEHARDTYRPDALVVPIIDNDFDENFRPYLGVCAAGDSPDDSWPSAHNLTHRVGATSPVSGRGRFSAAGETVGKIGSDAPRGSPAATIRTAARPLPASYLAFHIPIRG